MIARTRIKLQTDGRKGRLGCRRALTTPTVSSSTDSHINNSQSASVSSQGLEEQAGMSTRTSGVLETSRECVQSCKLDAVDTHRQIINSTESCFALHTRPVSTKVLHFIHGQYRQRFCTSYTGSIDSSFALHTRPVSTKVLHYIHGQYRQMFCTSYTDSIDSSFALHTRPVSTKVLHFIHGQYRQQFCTSYTYSIDSSFALHTRTVSTAVLHFIHVQYRQQFCTSYT